METISRIILLFGTLHLLYRRRSGYGMAAVAYAYGTVTVGLPEPEPTGRDLDSVRRVRALSSQKSMGCLEPICDERLGLEVVTMEGRCSC